MRIQLNHDELAILLQDHGDKDSGGWQALLARLKSRANQRTGDLELSETDIEKIGRYALDYGNGGWEDVLKGIFGRHLGPRLDGRR